MKKSRILLLGIISLLGTILIYSYVQRHQTKKGEVQNTVIEAASSVSPQKIDKGFAQQINMQTWLFSEEHNVYYQLGIPYCRNPREPDLQQLSIFIPHDYMQCIKNDDDTYTCGLNKQVSINKYDIYNAPFVIAAGDSFNEQQPTTTYQNFSEFTKKGMIYVVVGRRGIKHGFPAAITDLKAAIRYLRANKTLIAGNVEQIFLFGSGAGATLSSIIGSSGDSALFNSYLEEIGALSNVSDAIYGVMAWSPISSYTTANAAYEWSMGTSRRNLTPGMQQLSKKLAKEYADYINRAGFVDESNQNLTIQSSTDGYYQNGSYYDFVKKEIEYSLSAYLLYTSFPHSVVYYHDDNRSSIKRHDITGTYVTIDKYINALNNPKPWVKASSKNKNAKIATIADFVEFFRPAVRTVGSFDDFNLQSTENMLFAGPSSDKTHFDALLTKILQNTPYYERYVADLHKSDAQGSFSSKRAEMFSPLYYLLPSKPGFRTAVVAPYWRIRSGIFQTNTALTEEINLSLALQHYTGVKSVDFALVWESAKYVAEQEGEPLPNFLAWIKQVAK